MTTFDITTDYAGKRADACLADALPDYTRGEVTKAIKAGKILCNDKTFKPSYKLKVDDVLKVPALEKTTDELLPNHNIALDIVEETDDFLVINKPRGLQVHPSHTEKMNTLCNGLLAYYPAIATVGDDKMRPGIMSRLDKYTSGLMVIAKTDAAFDALKASFAGREVTKVYHTLVWGEPKELDAEIDAPIARAVGYTRQKVAFGKFTGDAKEAITSYKTLSTLSTEGLLPALKADEKPPTISHIEVRPHTGRMHQIRVHMAHIGRSIIGDIKYERKNEKALNKRLFAVLPEDDFHTFYLHAKELSFTLEGRQHSYKSDLPPHFDFIMGHLS